MNSPDDLESELRALGDALSTPDPRPSDVAHAVRARLEGPGTEPLTDGGRRRRHRWRWAGAGVAVIVAVLAGLTPQGQAAVGHILRFAGIEVHVDEQPGPLPSGVPSPLPGERRVTLDEARRTVRFPFSVPTVLGDPQDVRVSDGGRVVSLFWPGLRLDAYNGVLSPVWRKDLGGPFPEQVMIGGSEGWWISSPHQVTYLPYDGGEHTMPRRAEPTLIWQKGLVGYRLEGPANVAQARRIAESVR
ncbi:hypothetical protein DQ384_09995 [Sphaerisporangium album]|uniref:DUF4367 domain-containing protein n=1 Tax=Sphaerisporangium album TaxID=509200 RepID=A0A367FQG1_9ACTN|nr:hypothetical protein [Sphaerisporangium album]RCG31845.1 hypothetical protein DQ384_09995 [Sphaerisporangium album]